MAVDPKAWIYDFISHVPSIISAPAKWIADRVFGAFSDGVAFARWLKSGFYSLYVKGIYYAQRVTATVAEAYQTAVWIITVEIPRRVQAALTTAVQYAARIVADAKSYLGGLITNLRNWATTEISKVRKAASDLLSWATSQVNALRDKLTKTVDVWYDRMTHPDKMAAWLIGALMGPLWAYIYAHRDKIAGWLLRSSPAFTAWLARTLDDILGRIL